MFKFLKSLLGIFLVALLGYVMYTMATQNANDSIKTLHVSADNTTTISGIVLENQSRCFEKNTAQKCFLKLRVGTKTVYIVYSANDNKHNIHRSFCVNENAAATGKTVRAGQSVKVRGFYRKDGETDTVLTCPSKEYSLQVLP